MNNIEILEERINFCKNNTECREELKQCFGCTFEIEEIQAIENLIQGYKDLEEQRDSLMWQRNTIDIPKIEELEQKLNKVKEIVELYDNTLQCTRKYNQDLADILCDLEELLEEGE